PGAVSKVDRDSDVGVCGGRPTRLECPDAVVIVRAACQAGVLVGVLPVRSPDHREAAGRAETSLDRVRDRAGVRIAPAEVDLAARYGGRHEREGGGESGFRRRMTGD